MKQPQVLVTGATGFVGEAVVFRLLRDKVFTPVAAVRSETRLSGLCSIVRWDLEAPVVLGGLADVQVVIHCAARVHVMRESATDSLAEFRKINVEGTLQLARSAAKAGVKRFIYISSIKVNGESTEPGVPFTVADAPASADAYGISKEEAEHALKQLSHDTGMELVIIRPPLVYGPGVKANFLSMMKWIDRGVPLPLGSIHNRRSLVSVGNLVDLIVTCIDHPGAAGHDFMVSDGCDLSTTELLTGVAKALGKSARLISVPVWILHLVGSITGRKNLTQRLCGSLQVDISETRRLLNWSPPVDTETALRQTAEYYRDKLGK